MDKVVNSVNGVGVFFQHNFGWFMLAGVIILVIWLMKRKGLWWIMAALLIVVPVILALAPTFLTWAGIHGSDWSQDQMCSRYGGNWCPKVSGSQFDDTHSNESDNSQSNYTSSRQVTTGTLLDNALEVLITNTWGDLEPNSRPLLTEADLPKGVKAQFLCTHNATVANEVWSWKFRDTNHSWVDDYDDTSNGIFAHAFTEVSCASQKLTTVVGTGDWYDLCGDVCYVPGSITTTTITTPADTTTSTDTTSITISSAPCVFTGSDTYCKVQNYDGARVRLPVNGVCTDNGKADGLLTDGTEVTITNVWPSNNISGFRGMMPDGRCVHLSVFVAVP